MSGSGGDAGPGCYRLKIKTHAAMFKEIWGYVGCVGYAFSGRLGGNVY